ncbi:hypothetical protein F0562_002999 [Nyssa sinensis]|uniref:Uncharacterized protein n=1 Tax=Nyssa sinensis TaxID=561372 RepID=A0A5J5BXC2_9ASTE|nr:hypothetical protein F0562_002999 [Nyssa sinensis]
MAYLQPNYPNISKGYRREPLQRSYRCMKQMMAGSRISWKRAGHNVRNGEKKTGTWERGYGFVLQCCSSSSSSSSSTSSPGEVDLVEKDGNFGDRKGQSGYLVSEYGWRVRRMFEEESEMRKVAQVQAEAFHVPMIFFNDLFFDFFQAEVLSGLVYRLRNSPPDRYACLVAEGATSEAPDHRP